MFQAWRCAVADSWESVQLTFNNKAQLKGQLSWLLKQLHERPWLLHSLEFRSGTSYALLKTEPQFPLFSGSKALYTHGCVPYTLQGSEWVPFHWHSSWGGSLV